MGKKGGGKAKAAPEFVDLSKPEVAQKQTHTLAPRYAIPRSVSAMAPVFDTISVAEYNTAVDASDKLVSTGKEIYDQLDDATKAALIKLTSLYLAKKADADLAGTHIPDGQFTMMPRCIKEAKQADAKLRVLLKETGLTRWMIDGQKWRFWWLDCDLRQYGFRTYKYNVMPFDTQSGQLPKGDCVKLIPPSSAEGAFKPDFM